MMSNKETIYLDTSIPSAYYDNRTPQRQKITKGWWDNELENFDVIISNRTKKELEATKISDLKTKLLKLVRNIKVVDVTDECENLAKEYLNENIVPIKYEDDAIHIAVATIYNVDILVSWNFAHIVNHKTRLRVKGINLLRGYKEIQIESPYELGGTKYE